MISLILFNLPLVAISFAIGLATARWLAVPAGRDQPGNSR